MRNGDVVELLKQIHDRSYGWFGCKYIHYLSDWETQLASDSVIVELGCDFYLFIDLGVLEREEILFRLLGLWKLRKLALLLRRGSYSFMNLLQLLSCLWTY